jgi:hypothetical protein
MAAQMTIGQLRAIIIDWQSVGNRAGGKDIPGRGRRGALRAALALAHAAWHNSSPRPCVSFS